MSPAPFPDGRPRRRVGGIRPGGYPAPAADGCTMLERIPLSDENDTDADERAVPEPRSWLGDCAE